MNKVRYGWIYQATGQVNPEGKRIYTATRSRDGAEKSVAGTEEDLDKIVKRISEMELEQYDE